MKKIQKISSIEYQIFENLTDFVQKSDLSLIINLFCIGVIAILWGTQTSGFNQCTEINLFTTNLVDIVDLIKIEIKLK